METTSEMEVASLVEVPRAGRTAASAWLQAIRPKTLPAAIAPIVVGSAVAHAEGGFVPWVALLCALVATLLQIAANLANDVFDFRRGADTAERLGPVRVTQSGTLSPSAVFGATAIVALLAVGAGLGLVVRGGWPLLVLGALALAAAVAYTGGPFPLAYLGLGEVFVFLFFGMVGVAGSAYAQTLQLSPRALVAAVPIGCLAAAILVVNNLRDIATDRIAGKRTLAVRIGDRGSRQEYVGLVAVAYGVAPLVGLLGWSGGWWVAWLTLPQAVGLTRRLWAAQGRALNPVLGETAAFGLLFAGHFVASLVL